MTVLAGTWRRALVACAAIAATASFVAAHAARAERAPVAAPDCGIVLETACDVSADPGSYCRPPAAGVPSPTNFDCVYAAARGLSSRPTDCASALCVRLLQMLSPYLSDYADPAHGCFSLAAVLTEASSRCLDDLAGAAGATRTFVALGGGPGPDLPHPSIPDIDEALADAGDRVDHVALAQFTTCLASVSPTLQVNAGLSLAACGGGSGGTTYYRMTDDPMKTGEQSPPGNYNHKYSNTMYYRDCYVDREPGGPSHGDSNNCTGEVFLLTKDGSRIGGSEYYGITTGGDGAAADSSFPRKAAKPVCQFLSNSQQGQSGLVSVTAYLVARCYYVYG